MKHLLHAGLAALVLASVGSAQEVRTFRTQDFATWSYPKGLVNIGSELVTVRRFGKAYNAVADRDEHATAIVVGEHGKSKLRAGSGEATVSRLADQNPGTWWKPNQGDELQTWWVELDLGRAVAASAVRVVFPDTEGARPFAFFSVFTSPGVPLYTSAEQIVFTRLGRPINNNTARVVEFPLATYNKAVTTGQYLVTKDSLNFDLIRFIRFEAAGRNADAALAEIEVDAIGFNLTTKITTEERLAAGLDTWGGYAWTSTNHECNACGKGTSPNGIIDGDLAGRYWTIESAGAADWRSWGQWWGADLGTVYRVDRIVFEPFVVGYNPILYGYDRERQSPWVTFDLLVSDGTPSLSADPEVEGLYEYELLSEVNNDLAPKRWLYDWQFPTRSIRYLFWRLTRINSGSWGRASQIYAFHSEGYPVQVELVSPDLDLGSAYSVRRVEWDGDLPEGTRIQVETQTGNGYQKITRYYLSNGLEVTKAEWDAAKARNKGPVVEDTVRDPSWSAWSLPHRFSGQEFLSPTPRRWLKARIRLISDRPEVMASLRSLSLVLNTPVVNSGLTGVVTPRVAELDSLRDFRYTIRPGRATTGDLGFDRVVITVPPESGGATLVSALVGGKPVPATDEMRGDSLIVSLPPPAVKSDSVEVVFRTRVYESPTIFEALVLNSTQTDNFQGVVPADLGATEVYVPQTVTATSFFQNLVYDAAFTPNGDGSNDRLNLSFAVIKTSRQPEVRIFTLAGGQVIELADQTPAAGRSAFTWDGRDRDGALVPPGIYLLQLSIETDAKNQTVQKLVHVLY
ncbi:MAG: gliding motility-associated C-terminal domain-containing protein [Candidatus Latescibacterota bacterium]|jgi:hypothetical protein